ncbi:hypothetical protein, partial [Aromatoleum aromaticum]|uniref:hypothetical protein n=1 Tax=Aromatoleum aromaticum TaxID=551760 RepID=UPI001B7CF7E2
QRIFTDFCEHSIFAMPDLPEDNPATAATQYPHLSVVQLFKEPLPLQRERDSDRLRCCRQPPPASFLTTGEAPSTATAPRPPPQKTDWSAKNGGL